VVNTEPPCDHWAMPKPLAALVIVFALAACSTGTDRELSRYYDPEGLFTAKLPAANALAVTPPQPPTQGSPGILSGVVSQPPAPSPSPQGQFGGGLAGGLGQTERADQTTYQAFVVTTDTFAELSDMTLYFLTGDPSIDVRDERAIDLAGTRGRLVVADALEEGEARASVAAAFSLGRDGVGYVVGAIFPAGQWDAEESDFLRIVDSFRTEIPPVVATFPVTAGDA
jgi:hypothetical protein